MSEASDRAIADAPAGNWVDQVLPQGLRPYARLARLDRPPFLARVDYTVRIAVKP